MTAKKRNTDSYTAPAPKRKPNTRGGKRKRETWSEIDLSRGPVTLTSTYVPDGSDPDDT